MSITEGVAAVIKVGKAIPADLRILVVVGVAISLLWYFFAMPQIAAIDAGWAECRAEREDCNDFVRQLLSESKDAAIAATPAP